MGERVVFRVDGKPQPAGSKRAFAIKRKDAGGWVATGRVAVMDANPHTKTWQAECADAGALAMARYFGADWQPFRGPVAMVAIFYLRRPKGHFGTGRNAGALKASAPEHPTTKPDTTKLFRALEDGLTGVVWADDAQVIEQAVSKTYSAREGAHVVVWELDNGHA